MAPRGRKPTPTGTKKALGNPGKRALPADEAVVPEGQIVRPRYLKGRAAKLWDEYAPICEGMGTLTPADVRTLASWCVLEAAFEKDGAGMSASLIAQKRMYEEALQMTASSRARGGTSGKQKPKDPADAFFGQKPDLKAV